MSEKDLTKCFETSDEFITTLSSTKGQLARCQREKDFIDGLVPGDPEQGKQGLYPGEIRREDIVSSMVKAGLIKNPDSYWGKFQIRRNLGRVHKADYWRGYSFIKLTKGNFDFTLYKIRMDDISGLDPC